MHKLNLFDACCQRLLDVYTHVVDVTRDVSLCQGYDRFIDVRSLDNTVNNSYTSCALPVYRQQSALAYACWENMKPGRHY